MSSECHELHPWSAFLDARYRAILWMHHELKYSDEAIAEAMSMDETQVNLIRKYGHMPNPV